jgi:hypothetical protein
MKDLVGEATCGLGWSYVRDGELVDRKMTIGRRDRRRGRSELSIEMVGNLPWLR